MTREGAMSETRKIAAILVSDVVGYSRLAGTDEDRTLARLRALRSDLIDPTISVHHGRIVKRTGDGSVIEFRSVVDAVRCALEVQHAMVERNAGVALEKRIEFRIGIHLGDVVEETDGDLMGDGVNIAARLEGVCEPGAICLSEDAYRQVKSRLDLPIHDLGPIRLKNIAEPVKVYALEVGPRRKSTPAETSPRKRLRLIALAVIGVVAVAAAFLLPKWDQRYLDQAKRDFLAGRAAEAIESYRHAGRLTLEAQVFLIASYAKVGRNAEARVQAQELLRNNPKFSVNEFLSQESNARVFGGDAALRDGLVVSGLPLDVRFECLVRNVCP
jgi:class 3 adenylate cyclase